MAYAGDENKENEDSQREYDREYDMQALFRHAHLKTQGYYSVSKIDVTFRFSSDSNNHKCLQKLN